MSFLVTNLDSTCLTWMVVFVSIDAVMTVTLIIVSWSITASLEVVEKCEPPFTKSELVIVNGNLTERQYIDRIIRPVAVSMFCQRPGLRFLQEYACPHTARFTRDFLANNNVNTIPFAAYSPDCSPIEHIWGVLGRRLK